MVTIRLRRFGKRRAPTYRLIVSDKRKDTLGTYLEELGAYNPRTNPPTVSLKVDRVKHWLSHGAAASDTVYNLFVDQKIIDAPKRKVGGNPHRGKAEAPAETAPSAVPPPAEAEKATA